MTRAMTPVARTIAAAGFAALFTLASLPSAARADEGREQRTSIAVGAPGVHVATRLNTPHRFYGPLPTADAVKTMMARPGMARDLEAVFRAAGVEYLAAQAAQVMTAASPGTLTPVSVPIGQRFEWMAQRVGGVPSLLTNVEWRGSSAFDAYQFFVDDGVHGYTFVLPKACGNLSLVTTGASPRAAAADAARRAEDARKAEEARRAEDARRAAEARAAEDAKRADDERRAAEARADEARRADDARRAEEARRAEAARQQAAEAAERDRRAKVDVFFDVLGGKERRVRELVAATATTAAVEGGRCAGLAGIKAGPDFRLGGGWRFAPALGVAVNVRDSDNTSVFADGELNYWIGDKGFIGIGAGVWDFTHSDTVTGSGLVHFGRELGRTPGDVRFLIVGEGRLFADGRDDLANNYQAWAGLRVVFR